MKTFPEIELKIRIQLKLERVITTNNITNPVSLYKGTKRTGIFMRSQLVSWLFLLPCQTCSISYTSFPVNHNPSWHNGWELWKNSSLALSNWAAIYFFFSLLLQTLWWNRRGRNHNMNAKEVGNIKLIPQQDSINSIRR